MPELAGSEVDTGQSGAGSQVGPVGPVIPWGSATKGSRSSLVGQALRVFPALIAGLGLAVTPVATGDGVGVRRLEIQVFVEGGGWHS